MHHLPRNDAAARRARLAEHTGTGSPALHAKGTDRTKSPLDMGMTHIYYREKCPIRGAACMNIAPARGAAHTGLRTARSFAS